MEDVKLRFGGLDRRLVFKPSTMREFENTTGETLKEALPRGGFNTLAVLLWIGMKHEDRRLTLQQVWQHLDSFVEDGGDMGDLWDAASFAMMESGLLGRRGKAEQSSPTSTLS